MIRNRMLFDVFFYSLKGNLKYKQSPIVDCFDLKQNNYFSKKNSRYDQIIHESIDLFTSF